ncbi:MAG: hypothetical protein U0414_40475 [Polyangiaceae bacterium]
MSNQNGVTATALSEESFRASFGTLKDAILAEWPAIDGEALTATDGELEKVVALVAAKTEHTKTLVRKHLAELSTLDAKGAPGAAKKWASQANDVFEKFEKRTADLVKELRGTVLVNAKEKVRENLLVSLVMALGLGLLLGLVFGGLRRSRD